MPLFMCSKCGTMDNTALADYWGRRDAPLCSECSPLYDKWHGRFEKRSAAGYMREEKSFILKQPLRPVEKLNAEQSKVFADALADPPEPNDALRAAASRYNSRQ